MYSGRVSSKVQLKVRLGFSYLQIVIAGYVGAEDVDVGTFIQFFRYPLLRGRFVSDEADDGVVAITG